LNQLRLGSTFWIEWRLVEHAVLLDLSQQVLSTLQQSKCPLPYSTRCSLPYSTASALCLTAQQMLYALQQSRCSLLSSTSSALCLKALGGLCLTAQYVAPQPLDPHVTGRPSPETLSSSTLPRAPELLLSWMMMCSSSALLLWRGMK